MTPSPLAQGLRLYAAGLTCDVGLIDRAMREIVEDGGTGYEVIAGLAVLATIALDRLALATGESVDLLLQDIALEGVRAESL